MRPPARRALKGAWLALLLVLAGTGLAPAQADEPIKAEVTLDRPVVVAGDTRPVYALVRLSVREAVEDHDRPRPPINLALVLDRSGSMADAGKLEYLKRAAGLAIDLLGERDVLSVVEYDDQITVMWPADHVSAPEPLKRLIETLEPRNNTNLAGGMMAGVDQLRGKKAQRLAGRDAINRVLLLSDGLANEGVTEPAAIRALVREAKSDGVAISTLGLGRDYDEDLMQDIAENGGGRYYYIENPNQMARIFAEELNTLFKTMARDGVITIKGAQGAEVLGFEGMSANLGDFYGGERRALLIRLPVAAAGLGPLSLGTIEFTYRDDRGALHQFAHNLSVEVTGDQARAKAAENHDAAVEATLAETERGQKEAVRLLESGNHEGAKQRMSELVRSVDERRADLKDIRLDKKIEALSVERDDMAAAALAPEAESEYLKRSKQRLYQAKQGQRTLSQLQEGDRGLEVERLQEALSREGFYKGPVDGIYSASLAEAVKAFQKAQNLGTDGVAGPATMKELGLY